MKDLKDIAKGIAIGIMLGLVIVFGFVIASLTGCGEAGRMLTLPVATEEEATLEPTEDPAVMAGYIRYGPGVDTVPKGYIPAKVGPDGSIVLAYYWEAYYLWEEGLGEPEKPLIAMDPNLKHIRIYPVEELLYPPHPEAVWPEDYMRYGELTKYTLLEVALEFNLPFCILPPGMEAPPEPREVCLYTTQAEVDARWAWEEEEIERKKREW